MGSPANAKLPLGLSDLICKPYFQPRYILNGPADVGTLLKRMRDADKIDLSYISALFCRTRRLSAFPVAHFARSVFYPTTRQRLVDANSSNFFSNGSAVRS